MDAARAAWRRVIGLLDTFLMSLSTRLRLLGSTLQACRAVTAERRRCFVWKKSILLLPVRAFQRRVERPQTPTLRQYQHAPLEHWLAVTVAEAAASQSITSFSLRMTSGRRHLRGGQLEMSDEFQFCFNYCMAFHTEGYPFRLRRYVPRRATRAARRIDACGAPYR